MKTNAKDIISVVATHPGNVLKSELQARGITQKDFAKTLGMPAPNLNEIIKGKRNITKDIAIKLEGALGIPFQTWMNLQTRYYYVSKRRQELSEEDAVAVERERKLDLIVNIKALYAFYGIKDTRASVRLKALDGRIIGMDELRELETRTVGFFKRSDKLRVDERNMRTWLWLAHSEVSGAKNAGVYTVAKGKLAAARIAEMANNETLSIEKIQEILWQNGIIYKHVPKLEAAPIDAYSTKVGKHPAIVVTYRYNDMDKLAFDVLHEIGHILNHLSDKESFISVERDYSQQSAVERDADTFAQNMLIDPAVWKTMISVGTRALSPYVVVRTLASEARKHGISPSIAVARYKHDTRGYKIPGYRSPKIVE